jgi:hypothetical protein
MLFPANFVNLSHRGEGTRCEHRDLLRQSGLSENRCTLFGIMLYPADISLTDSFGVLSRLNSAAVSTS